MPVAGHQGGLVGGGDSSQNFPIGDLSQDFQGLWGISATPPTIIKGGGAPDVSD